MNPRKAFPHLPDLIAHADWGVEARKRWISRAWLDQNGVYQLEHPERVGKTESFLRDESRQVEPNGCALIGFDFPIGLPAVFTRKAGIHDFLQFLRQAGQDRWADFYNVAETVDEITLERPFYPARPGRTSREHLRTGLGVNEFADLLRACDHPRPGRRAASTLFWTLGAGQVGKGAIIGWRDVLAPALLAANIPGSPSVKIWPFAGRLEDLLHPATIVVAETYPAEFYLHFGLDFYSGEVGRRTGKRDPVARQHCGEKLLDFIGRELSNKICLPPELVASIRDGFGPSPSGEDAFDSLVGLLGMLNVILGQRPLFEPEQGVARTLEGWILGLHPLSSPL
jgi:hypothetical protein